MNSKYLCRAKVANWENLPKELEWAEGYIVNKMDGEYTSFGFKEFEELVLVREFSGGGISWHHIDQDTICKCIGREDKNQKPVWENDIVTISVFSEVAEGDGKRVSVTGIICFDTMGMLALNVGSVDEPCYSNILQEIELAGIPFTIDVIGNVFDDPELLADLGFLEPDWREDQEKGL